MRYVDAEKPIASNQKSKKSKNGYSVSETLIGNTGYIEFK